MITLDQLTTGTKIEYWSIHDWYDRECLQAEVTRQDENFVYAVAISPEKGKKLRIPIKDVLSTFLLSDVPESRNCAIRS